MTLSSPSPRPSDPFHPPTPTFDNPQWDPDSSVSTAGETIDLETLEPVPRSGKSLIGNVERRLSTFEMLESGVKEDRKTKDERESVKVTNGSRPLNSASASDEIYGLPEPQTTTEPPQRSPETIQFAVPLLSARLDYSETTNGTSTLSPSQPSANPSFSLSQPSSTPTIQFTAPAAPSRRPGASLQAPRPTMNTIRTRQKVVLQPGYGPLDWEKLKRSGRNLAGVQGLARYTLKQLAEHKAEGDVWMAIQGKIYNVSAYVHFHPGGGFLLLLLSLSSLSRRTDGFFVS